MNSRQAVLVVALVATLAASWWVAQREEEMDSTAVVQPAEREVRASAARGARRAGADASAPGRLERLSVTRAPWPDLPNVARIVSFVPPRPPRPVAAAQARVAPPLPFRLVGAIEDERGKAVFLLEGSQVRMVRPGEQVAGNYRLDRITPAGVEFTYLPLNTKQTLGLRTP